MTTFLCFVIIIILIDIEDKLKKQEPQEKTNPLNLKVYLNEEVYLELDNDKVKDSYLFSSVFKTIGKIIDYDDTWFIFSYYDKNKRKNITRYLRINDLKSINRIKK